MWIIITFNKITHGTFTRIQQIYEPLITISSILNDRKIINLTNSLVLWQYILALEEGKLCTTVKL